MLTADRDEAITSPREDPSREMPLKHNPLGPDLLGTQVSNVSMMQTIGVAVALDRIRDEPHRSPP
jgi:hypothetical protein